MKTRHLLCRDCKEKIRKAEAKYKQKRRLVIKVVSEVSGRVALNK